MGSSRSLGGWGRRDKDGTKLRCRFDLRNTVIYNEHRCINAYIHVHVSVHVYVYVNVHVYVYVYYV